MTLASAIDLALALAFTVVMPWHAWRGWPRFVADARAGRPGLRRDAYRGNVVVQWSLALVLLVHWAYAGRSWPALGLGDPREHGVWPWVVVAGALALLLAQLWAGARASAADRTRGREQLGEIALFLPHDRTEYGWFVAVAITAGICEEIVYRGFLPWLVAFWLPSSYGSVWPLAVATILFGLGHAYQGGGGVVKSLVAAGIAAALVLWSGTLWPVIVLHIGVDLYGGTAGWWLLRERDGS